MVYILPSRNELLSSIGPDMKLTKGFLKLIYGYSVTEPAFADQAIKALEQAGCSKARTYYEEWVVEYETAYDAMIKPVADWYSRECERAWEAKKKEVSKLRKKNQMAKLNRQQHWTELSEVLGFPLTNGAP